MKFLSVAISQREAWIQTLCKEVHDGLSLKKKLHIFTHFEANSPKRLVILLTCFSSPDPVRYCHHFASFIFFKLLIFQCISHKFLA